MDSVYTTEHVAVGGTELMLLTGGTGRPLLVLHGVEGHEGWLALHDELAKGHTVLAPSHPGYGHTPAPEWIASIAHQAVFYNWYLRAAGFGEGSIDVVGVGIGGWIAAQMAIMSDTPLRHLVLVGAAGLRPTHSEGLDVFVTPWREVIERGFADPSVSNEYQRLYGAPLPEYGGIREAGRTMSIRMCYRPYMHDPSLAGMLGKISTPTLVVWGQQDAIIPLECGEAFQQGIPGAELRTLERCGHFAHLEQPQALARTIDDFCSGDGR